MNDLQKSPSSQPVGSPKLGPFLLTTKRAWTQQRADIRKEWLAYLGAFPRKRASLKSEIISTEVLPKFTRQFVRYQIENGVWTDGYLLIPQDSKTPLLQHSKMKHPAVVVFHATTPAQARQPAGLEIEKPELAIGVQLAERGYIALCPRNFIFGEGSDYKTHVATMQARHPTWKGMTRMTFDAIRAADFLESLPIVDKNRIGCVGHSLGAKEVLYAAAFDDRFKAAVFSEGGIGIHFSNWDAVWYLGDGVQEKSFPLEHHQLLALIAPRPFLLLAGESADNDKSWPFVETVMPVYKLLGSPNNVGWLNHREGHRYSPAARATAESFLNWHLK